MALLPQLYKIFDQKVQEMSHTYICPQYECNIRFFLHLVPLFLQPKACRSAKISTHTAHNKGFGVREKPELLSASQVDGRFEKESQCYNAT